MSRISITRDQTRHQAAAFPLTSGITEWVRALEELPHVRGQGQWPRVPGYDGTGTAEKSYPSLRSGAAAGSSYPTSEVRGGS